MPLDKREMYRMPWTLTDNPIGWLEVTDICNIKCKGCYRSTLAGHRDLEELKAEIRAFKNRRNCDGISIAGGEPLLHPNIMEIVSYIEQQGMKAVLLSNALALDTPTIKELKRAGLRFLSLHVDQWQTRKGWTGNNEVELLDLRQQIADRIDAVGGFHLTFGCTVYNENLQYVPDIAAWGQRNAGKVDGLVFITFRSIPTTDDLEYETAEQKVEGVDQELTYTTADLSEIQIDADEVWNRLREQDPAFHSGGYLGGTVRHSSFKWIITGRVLSKNRVYGYSGPRTLEMLQALNHAVNGTYPAYMDRSRIGPLVFSTGVFDRYMRRGALEYLRDIAARPRRLLDPVYVQSIVIVQAPDLLPDGSCDMCDGCPDMTWYKGELVRSCRWDEYRRYDTLLQVSRPPRHKSEGDAEAGRPSDAQPAPGASASTPRARA